MVDAEPDCQGHAHDGHRARLRAVDEATCGRAAEMFRALGDPGRLRILSMLASGELCVSEIAGAMEDSLPAVSQRLKLLRGERIVASRREGKHVYYRLADQHVVELLSNALEHARE